MIVLQNVIDFLLELIAERDIRRRQRKVSDAQTLKYIIIILQGGLLWHHLSLFVEACHWTVIYKRFVKWVKLDVFGEAWRRGIIAYGAGRLQEDPKAFGKLFIDASMVKNEYGNISSCIGPDHFNRSRSGTKMSCICDNRGTILSCVMFPANIPDIELVVATVQAIPIQIHPNKRYVSRLVGDTGYVWSPENKADLRDSTNVALVHGYRHKGNFMTKADLKRGYKRDETPKAPTAKKTTKKEKAAIKAAKALKTSQALQAKKILKAQQKLTAPKVPRKTRVPLVPFVKLPSNATKKEKDAAKMTRVAAMIVARAERDQGIANAKAIKLAANVDLKVAKAEKLKKEKLADKRRKAKIDKESVDRYIIETTFNRLDKFLRIKCRKERLIGQYIAFNQLALLMMLGKDL